MPANFRKNHDREEILLLKFLNKATADLNISQQKAFRPLTTIHPINNEEIWNVARQFSGILLRQGPEQFIDEVTVKSLIVLLSTNMEFHKKQAVINTTLKWFFKYRKSIDPSMFNSIVMSININCWKFKKVAKVRLGIFIFFLSPELFENFDICLVHDGILELSSIRKKIFDEDGKLDQCRMINRVTDNFPNNFWPVGTKRRETELPAMRRGRMKYPLPHVVTVGDLENPLFKIRFEKTPESHSNSLQPPKIEREPEQLKPAGYSGFDLGSSKYGCLTKKSRGDLSSGYISQPSSQSQNAVVNLEDIHMKANRKMPGDSYLNDNPHQCSQSKNHVPVHHSNDHFQQNKYSNNSHTRNRNQNRNFRDQNNNHDISDYNWRNDHSTRRFPNDYHRNSSHFPKHNGSNGNPGFCDFQIRDEFGSSSKSGMGNPFEDYRNQNSQSSKQTIISTQRPLRKPKIEEPPTTQNLPFPLGYGERLDLEIPNEKVPLKISSDALDNDLKGLLERMHNINKKS